MAQRGYTLLEVPLDYHPTWEQLCHDGMHRLRPAATDEEVDVSPNSMARNVGDPNC